MRQAILPDPLPGDEWLRLVAGGTESRMQLERFTHLSGPEGLNGRSLILLASTAFANKILDIKTVYYYRIRANPALLPSE